MIETLGLEYFKIRWHFFIRGINTARLRTYVLVILVAAILFFRFDPTMAYLYSLPWTGFQWEKVESDRFSFKTLWDWFELFIIPVALGLIAYAYRRAEAKRARQQAIDDENERALVSFYDYIEGYIDDDGEIERINQNVLNARAKLVMRRLDPERKSILIKFLHDLELI